MIAKLYGIVDGLGEDYAIINVNGVGYLVFASAKTLSKLSGQSQVSLWVETVVREDSISLYGFLHPLEKEWFLTLTKVQGVGAKVCLNILSALTLSQIAQAVSAQDKDSFARANGVGPKLAARIVTELKGKMVSLPIVGSKDEFLSGDDGFEPMDEVVVINSNSDKAEDVISALVNLGYQKIDAYRVANMVVAQNSDADVSELIRLALKEFVKKEF